MAGRRFVSRLAMAALCAAAGVIFPAMANASGERVLEAPSPPPRPPGVPDSFHPGPAGWDPGRRAGFAVWLDRAGRRWSTFSRDGGRSWTRPRPLRDELRLGALRLGPGEPVPLPPAELALPGDGRVRIVRFHAVGLPEWRELLDDLGVELLAYLPHNAHLVRMDSGLRSTVEALAFVDRLDPLHPVHRLAPELLDRLDEARGSESELRIRVVAFEWGEEAKRRIADRAMALGAEVAASWPSGHVLEFLAGRDQILALAAHDDVQWIDLWGPPGDDLDLVRPDVGADWVEDTAGYCGVGVRGEILDSGIDETHMDFDGILLHGAHSAGDHGTKNYGIVFGNGDRDGDGEARATGIMSCAGTQGIVADYDEVTDRFAHTQELLDLPWQASFQTNSWGSSLTKSYNSYSQEIDDIVWRLDLPITQSQSNTGNRRSRPEAWGKNVISVGGVFHYDTAVTGDDAWAFGASIGPAADGRIKPDLHHWYDWFYTTTSNNGYTDRFGGTSSATAAVAGVMGLLIEMWSDDVWGTSPQAPTVFENRPHAATVKALLVNSARQYPFSGPEHDLTRMHQGWGRPSARAALERAAVSFVVDEEQALEVGQTASYELVVPAGESELRVTLVYLDPPGTLSSSLHRINDLDLRVTGPTGTEYLGNVGLDVGTESVAGGQPNGVDTVENVIVASPAEGTWTVVVEAVEVNQDAHTETPADDVVFSLVVTGACGDADGDLVASCLGDCDDRDPAVLPGATEVCDGRDNDCDGLLDEDALGEDVDLDGVAGLCDNCPTVANPTQSDLDQDGAGAECDCSESNDQVWRRPGEVPDLLLRHRRIPGVTELDWLPPLDPGAAAVSYDTIRSSSGFDFGAGALCLESDDGNDTSAEDLENTPGSGAMRYYLVVAENDCPSGRGPAGYDSLGGERVEPRACP